MFNNSSSLRKKYLRLLLFAAVFLLYAVVIECPLKRIFGIECPFCGMTRAHAAFLCGDINAAFGFNRLFFLGLPTVALIYAVSKSYKNKALKYCFIAALALCMCALIINYILKLCNI